jgi:hypothetical protein
MFDVKIWETEDDRETGNTFIDDSFSSIEEAKAYANSQFNIMNYACVEVQNSDGDLFLHLSSDEYLDFN